MVLQKPKEPVEIADKVEDFHTKILEKLDELTALKEKLHNEYVPSSVCTHLEQCIKETEVCL